MKIRLSAAVLACVVALVALAGTDDVPVRVATVLSSAGSVVADYETLMSGDKIRLQKGETLRIGWYAGGRLEVWTGPGKLEIGDAGASSKRATLVSVGSHGERVGVIWSHVFQVVDLVRRGQIEEVRGKVQELEGISPAERELVAQGREDCEKMDESAEWVWDQEQCLYVLYLEYKQCTAANEILDAVSTECDCSVPFGQIPYCPIPED